MPESEQCPCGSGLQDENCCLQYINGGLNAPTAEALMRSRYTAYVIGHEAYLLASWFATTRPEKLNLGLANIHWSGLTICKTQAGNKGDSRGVVEFIARYFDAGRAGQVHESSRFIKQQGCWFYIDGDLISENKIARNAACSCGSGKKFKRCCGKKHPV